MLQHAKGQSLSEARQDRVDAIHTFSFCQGHLLIADLFDNLTEGLDLYAGSLVVGGQVDQDTLCLGNGLLRIERLSGQGMLA